MARNKWGGKRAKSHVGPTYFLSTSAYKISFRVHIYQDETIPCLFCDNNAHPARCGSCTEQSQRSHWFERLLSNPSYFECYLIHSLLPSFLEETSAPCEKCKKTTIAIMGAPRFSWDNFCNTVSSDEAKLNRYGLTVAWKIADICGSQPNGVTNAQLVCYQASMCK